MRRGRGLIAPEFHEVLIEFMRDHGNGVIDNNAAVDILQQLILRIRRAIFYDAVIQRQCRRIHTKKHRGNQEGRGNSLVI